MKFRFCVLGFGLSILLALTHPVLGQSSATQPVPQEDSSYIDAQGTAHITRVVEVPQTISPEAQKALANQEGKLPPSHDTTPIILRFPPSPKFPSASSRRWLLQPTKRIGWSSTFTAGDLLPIPAHSPNPFPSQT
jgi:hypothetical protein